MIDAFMPSRRMLLLAAALPLILSLAACAGGGVQKGEPALYDLSGTVAPEAAAGAAASGIVTPLLLESLQSPTWLNTPAMQYRLDYIEPGRRLSFGESRWVASPAELIEAALKRNNIVRKGRYEGQGCQLRLDLDEFIQSFDAPGSSHALVEVRAALVAARNPSVVAQRTFRLAPTAGADARSGVAAFGVAVRDLGSELNAWLAQVKLQKPELEEACRSGKL